MGGHSLAALTSMDLALRLDILHDDNVQSLVALCDSLGGAYWIVREGDTTNPHLHVHLTTSTKLNAVRQAFKRRFPLHSGNGHYSIKQCDQDVEGYDRYMAKGGAEGDDPIVIARSGLEYTLENIKEWHTNYWAVNQELMKKRRKRLNGAVADQLLQVCLDKGIKSRGGIGIQYLHLMKEANKPINTFAGKAAINTVWLALDEGTEARDCLLTDLVGAWAEDAIHQERNGVLK